MDDYYYIDDEDMADEMRSKKWSEGYLYILDYGDGKQFKIGITTKNPKIRASQIKKNAGMLLPMPIDAQIVAHLQVDTNPYYLEQLLHMQYRNFHAGGEWFRLGLGELAEIVSQIKPFGELTYEDRWFELYEGSFSLVLANAYPVDVDYIKNVHFYCPPEKFVIFRKENGEGDQEINKLLDEYVELKRESPDTFGHVVIDVR